MKKTFLLLFILALIFIPLSISWVNKDNFISPIYYSYDIIIRNDSRGDGFFSAKRSGKRVHNGIDLLADIGTPVLAARSGLVIEAISSKGMGNYVILQHSGGLTTIYGHLSSIKTRKGVFVRQGEVIGAVGKTGNANHPDMLPHLHFELRKSNIPQDPFEYLS